MSSCGDSCSCLKRQRPNTPPSATVDEDVWLLNGDEEHFRPADVDKDEIFGNDLNAPENVETLALRRSHAKQGFIEGLTEAKLKSTQRGFDEGYMNGSVLGLKIGEIISTLNNLRQSNDHAIQVEASELFELLKTELFISNVLSQKYFDEDVNLGVDGHEVVNKWDKITETLLNKSRQVF